MRLLHRWAIACSISLACSACGEPSGPERELSGKQLYDQHCARCHGLDGRPTAENPQARDLSDSRIVGRLTDEQMERIIEMGRPPSMPGFGGRFTEAALEVLVAHVRSLSGFSGPPAANDAARP